MMKIYRLSAPVGESYASLVLARDLNGYDEFSFKGSVAESWKVPTFKWKQDRNPNLDSVILGDAVYVFDAGLNIAVNEKSKDKLEKILNEQVEFLPIKVTSEAKNWYLLNIINRIDNALSLDKSTFKSRSGGRQGRLVQAVFSISNIPNDCVFIYPESSSNFMVHGDTVKQEIEDLNITGIEFNNCQTDSSSYSEAG